MLINPFSLINPKLELPFKSRSTCYIKRELNQFGLKLEFHLYQRVPHELLECLEDIEGLNSLEERYPGELVKKVVSTMILELISKASA